jgi:hypothetical protein
MFAYIFAAVEPGTDNAFALVLPYELVDETPASPWCWSRNPIASWRITAMIHVVCRKRVPTRPVRGQLL